MITIPTLDISRFINIRNHQVRQEQTEYTTSNIIPIATTTTSSVNTVGAQKEIALTFDDGPYGTSTDMVLNILEKENVPATFFLIGKNVEKRPNQVLHEITDGDIIGNHSYSHAKNLSTISSSTLREDISHAQKIISQVSGKVPHLFRPPYSRTSPSMLNEIQNEGYVVANWSIDPRDWDNNNSSTTIVSTILSHAKNGAVIIMHDGHEYSDYARMNTVQALPVIIESLKKEGYTFVTIDKLLKTSPYRN